MQQNIDDFHSLTALTLVIFMLCPVKQLFDMVSSSCVTSRTHNFIEIWYSLPGLFKQTLTASGIHFQVRQEWENQRTKTLVPFKNMSRLQITCYNICSGSTFMCAVELVPSAYTTRSTVHECHHTLCTLSRFITTYYIIVNNKPMHNYS